MPNTYQISIVNKSGVSQSYLLFAAVPVVQTGASSSGQVFQNVFMAAPPIASRPDGSSSTTFTITRQFYGICGTSVQNLAAGVQVATSDYEAVTLGAGNNPGTTLDFTTVGGAQFTIPLPPETAPAGGYIISTDSSFQLPDPNNTFIGMGGLNMRGDVVPVATFLAEPGQTYTIFPVVKYYIATGTYTPGQIINVEQVGTTQLCDFTNSTYSSMTFIHNNDGSYSQAPLTEAKAIKLATLQSQKYALLGAEDTTAVAPRVTQNGCGPCLSEAQLAQGMHRVFLKLVQSANAVSA